MTLLKGMLLMLLIMFLSACQQGNSGGPGSDILDGGGGDDLKPKPNGVTFWFGCGTTIDTINKVSSCSAGDACATTADFFESVQSQLNECTAQKFIPAFWVEVAPEITSIDKQLFKEWMAPAKTILANLKTNKASKETVEASLNKLVYAVASIENRN